MRFRGSPVRFRHVNHWIAQRVEQQILNLSVAGSTPAPNHDLSRHDTRDASPTTGNAPCGASMQGRTAQASTLPQRCRRRAFVLEARRPSFEAPSAMHRGRLRKRRSPHGQRAGSATTASGAFPPFCREPRADACGTTNRHRETRSIAMAQCTRIEPPVPIIPIRSKPCCI